MSNNNRFKGASIIAMLGLFLTFFQVSVAQTAGTISGQLTDEQGAAIFEAEIRLNSRDGLRRFTLTDKDGTYQFTGLAPGNYILEVKSAGFAALTKQLRLERGETETLNLQLSVATVNENVVIVAAGTPQRTDEVSMAVTLVVNQEIEAKREV
ncbi:MAG: carboxypeptidase-like regulatory domain-containing protein [Pyrinomonadaceae bacterium]